MLAHNAATRATIVAFTEQHLDDALTAETAAYPVGWSRQIFLDELARVSTGTRYYVAAEIDSVLVGYAGMMLIEHADGNEAHITNVVVIDRVRGQGVATKLLVHLAHVAIGRGCVSWTLEVRTTSASAISLYRRFGFAPAGVRPRYYNNTEDALVMWCHDIDTAAYAARLTRLEERP